VAITSVFGKDRRLITILFVTVLTGVALTNGVSAIYEEINKPDFVPVWSQWILPWVFIVTLVKFAIGSYDHLLRMEPRDGRDQIADGIWFWDLWVIGVLELVLLAFMGRTVFADNRVIPLTLLAIPCFTDVLWVVSIPLTGKWRPGAETPLTWYWTNSLSGIALAGILLVQAHDIFNLESMGVLVFLVVWFTEGAAVDLYYQLKDRIYNPNTYRKRVRLVPFVRLFV
jgi:hypothetical protein